MQIYTQQWVQAMRQTTSSEKLNTIDNKGSVMIMVLVAFLFVSVLVAIIFSTVTVNYKMRSIDRRTKDEFYYAEKALNEIYTGLGQDCSDQMGKSYNIILSSYKKSGNSGYNYKVQEAAYNGFVINFLNAMNTNVFSKKDEIFNEYIVKDVISKNSPSANTGRAKLKSSGRVRYYADHDRNIELFPTSSDFTDAGNVRSIAIEDVCVISNPDAKANIGYVSEIKTDIVINIPSIDFFNLNNGKYDFALAANNGLYFEPGSIGIINGNVYGGTIPYVDIRDDSDDSTEYGGINVLGATVSINDAGYVISGGDINVVAKDNKHASFTVKSSSGKNNQIWFENFIVGGTRSIKSDPTANVLVEGNLFAAGDMQIDADRAEVTVNGSYYGYNDGKVSANGTLSNKETIWKSVTDYVKTGANNENPATKSSAIIVNGHNDVLDMTNISTLLLAGTAYINHESKQASSNDAHNVYVDNGKIDAGNLGESLALKPSQSITLVPTVFLTKPNPSPTDESGDSFVVSASINSIDWFGKKYVESVSDNRTNHTTFKVRRGGSGSYYAYCYLNFKEGIVPVEEKYGGMTYRDAYVQEVLDGADTGESPTAAEIKRELLNPVKIYKSSVQVGNSESRIYANSSILAYDDTNGLYRVSNNASNGLFEHYSDNLYKRYRLLDTYLEPLKDTPLSSSVGVKGIDSQDLTIEASAMPMARFFWLNGIENAVNSMNALSYELADDTDHIKLVLLCSDEDSPIDLATVEDQNGDKIFNGKTNAIVLILGDSIVSTGKVDINGLIASKGKITVNNGAILKVTHDASIINKRIIKELELLDKNGGFNDTIKPESNAEAKQWYIYYLLNTDSSSYDSSSALYKLKKPGNQISITNGEVEEYRVYEYSVSENGVKKQRYDVDYTNYIYFDNWTKGQQ